MFLHAELQSVIRNICVASYPATAVLSTKCKLGARLRARRKGNGGDELRLNSTGSAPIRFQLMAPRLQRAANLSIDTRLRQRNARLRRHLGDDRHVVLGPGHRLAA